MDKAMLLCPVCKTKSSLLDVVDLNKSCEEQHGKYFALAGIPIYYALCDDCGFCWAPELHGWPLASFEEFIYNKDYVLVDPAYLEDRPRTNADVLRSTFPNLPASIRHLDYGGGNGLLASLLRESSWDSVSYDPFVDKDTTLQQLGKFDLITAFEVFEHVPDVRGLVSDLSALLADDGVVLFSTLLSDGHIHRNQRLAWWYASPRNGHISLMTRKSLSILARENGFNFGSFSDGLHTFFRDVPLWAKHVIRMD